MAIVTRNVDGTTPWASTNNPNSCRITYAGGDTAANILLEVDTFLLAHGWTAISTANSPITVRSYKALNYDGNSGGTGINWKYIILDVATAGVFYCKVYESVTGTTGTNVANFSDQATYSQRLDVTNGGTLWITSTPLNTSTGISSSVTFYSQVPAGNGSPTGGTPSGCFEFMRTNPNHTIASGYPFHVSLSGNSANAGYIGHPRMINNAVGNQYCIANCPDASGIGYSKSAIISANSDPLTGKYRAQEAVCVQSQSVYGNSANYIVGPLRNLKVINVGTIGDTMTLKLNSSGWIDPAGTDTVFLIYPHTTSFGGLAVPI